MPNSAFSVPGSPVRPPLDRSWPCVYTAGVFSRLHAAWLLGWSLVRTLARRLFDPHGHGLALFHANYASDRLLPMSTDDRRALPAFSGCVACGCCDVGQAQAIAASGGRYRGMMAFMLSASRSIPDFDAAADALRHVDFASLEALEQRCPVHIPFRQVAAFVEAKAAGMS